MDDRTENSQCNEYCFMAQLVHSSGTAAAESLVTAAGAVELPTGSVESRSRALRSFTPVTVHVTLWKFRGVNYRRSTTFRCNVKRAFYESSPQTRLDSNVDASRQPYVIQEVLWHAHADPASPRSEPGIRKRKPSRCG